MNADLVLCGRSWIQFVVKAALMREKHSLSVLRSLM
jgi:hypothetical protein